MTDREQIIETMAEAMSEALEDEYRASLGFLGPILARAALDALEAKGMVVVRKSSGMVAESVEADFETDHWTFRMVGPYWVGAGEYLVMPIRWNDDDWAGQAVCCNDKCPEPHHD